MPKYLVSYEVRYEVNATNADAAEIACEIASNPEIAIPDGTLLAALEKLGLKGITKLGGDLVCCIEE